MAIQKIMNSLIYGLSTDMKPTTYATNTVWYEVDTGNIYVWSGSAWTLNDGASKTETLTNKTINTSNNTITDTSAAVGDIMAISSGTAFKRLAMGTANQVLAVNAGGTAIGWATNSGSGAPTSSAYVTIGNDSTLTAERALAVGNGMSLTDGGANSSVTLDVSPIITSKNRAVFFDDFISPVSFAQSYVLTSGTGASAGVTTNQNATSFGEAIVTSGSTSTGSALFHTLAACITYGLGVTTSEWRVIVPVLSTGTQQYIFRVGFLDSSTSSADATNGVYFEYNQSSSTNWLMCTSKGGTRTKTASSTAVTTSYVRLKFVIDAAAASVTYYINDTSIGTINTNIPGTSLSSVSQLQMQIIKSVGTTSTSIFSDYVSVTLDYTTPR